MKILALSFLSWLFFFGCTDKTFLEPVEPPVELKYFTDTHHGVIGQQIKIFDNMPDSSNARFHIEFSGVGDWVIADSIVNDTMFVIVPFTHKLLLWFLDARMVSLFG